MSAYALPGLFPPLPLEESIHFTSNSNPEPNSCLSHNENKLHHRPCQPQQSSHDIIIRIKEAKVDAMQLIQSLTSKDNSSGKKSARRRLSPPTQSKPSHEEAMQFELDVNYKGRQYSIVRSLYRLRQLRDELIEELEHYVDGSRATSSDDIPELPALEENSCYSQSFSTLQALLHSYAPMLETWLSKMFSLVATRESPTLSHFFFDPLCLIPPSLKTSSSEGRFTRKSSLESIAELDQEEAEDCDE